MTTWCTQQCESIGCEPDLCRGQALTSEQWYSRAVDAIPGGVNSPIRAFKGVGGTPVFIARAKGGRVWSVEGTEYIDLVQSYGATIHGHAHPKIVEAITKAAADGTTYGMPTAREVRLAETIGERVPSCELVRFMNSGTEATMTALRVARGFTGRSTVVKFAGNYHGHGDLLLAAGGSAVAVLGLSDSVGVPASAVASTLVVPYNVVPTLTEEVAAVIVEPVAANMGLVPPLPGFLEGLRAECDRVGALLIFDEVITGFRVSTGSYQICGAPVPDLTCFGKVIGGGLPIGALGGRRDVMESLAPVGPVFQAGTLSGNPLATAAGLAALDLLTEDVVRDTSAKATRLADGFRAAFAAAGASVVMPTVSTLMGLHLAAAPAIDYDTAKTTDTKLYARFFHQMLQRKITMAPGAYEVIFASVAHSDADIDHVIECAHESAAVAVATAP
jgi:glutamate-1-semialdehyde 2,1-aminomutase